MWHSQAHTHPARLSSEPHRAKGSLTKTPSFNPSGWLLPPQEKLRELVQPEAEKAWGAAHYCDSLPGSHSPFSAIWICSLPSSPRPLQCIPILTMILSLQAPLPWSLPWPAPSLLEHEEDGFLLHHLQVWQRKSPKQIRETRTHSLLLLTVSGICRRALGLSQSHKEVARSENSVVFSSMNSVLPLLSTWMITFDFSQAVNLV